MLLVGWSGLPLEDLVGEPCVDFSLKINFVKLQCKLEFVLRYEAQVRQESTSQRSKHRLHPGVAVKALLRSIHVLVARLRQFDAALAVLKRAGQVLCIDRREVEVRS